MDKQKTEYRQIVKATTIFGGVQGVNILVAIIRSKFIALLLGPSGMGIVGLLNSTTGLIGGITELGLGVSAVKDLSEANGAGDGKRISTVSTVIRKLVWITGTLGALITLILSPWLSQVTFGNRDFTYSFMWLSATLLFKQLTNGYLALLQGLRKLQFLAKANLAGSILGLLITVPLYYFLGINGIVPAIIISSVISLILAWIFTGKTKIESDVVSFRQVLAEGKNMILLGFMISLSGLISMGVGYLVRIFISHRGGVDQVGLYTAGFAIVNTYVGLIFSAMGTDYFPRLSAVAGSNEECNKVINQQAEIALLILAPLVLVFLVLIRFIVITLYSSKFIDVNEMILWAALGTFFKAASWAIAFVFMAKGLARIYFWNEFLANIYVLILNVLGYYFWGLTGLGISFLAAYILYLIQVYIISNIKFNFSFTKEFRSIFIVQLTFAILCLFLSLSFKGLIRYLFGLPLIIVSAFYSYKMLDKRLDIKTILANRGKEYFTRKEGRK